MNRMLCMNAQGLVFVTACFLAVGIAPTSAEPLTPVVAEWAVGNADAITAGLRKAIVDPQNNETIELRHLVNVKSSQWRIYSRDKRLLFAIPVEKNLLMHERANGTLIATKIIFEELQQNNGIPIKKALDKDSIRVVLIEPGMDWQSPRIVSASVRGMPSLLAPFTEHPNAGNVSADSFDWQMSGTPCSCN